MSENNVVELLKGVVGELRQVASSETVIGEPITVGDRTVIPVVKVTIGFGAGGGQGEMAKGESGFGGGGGGGAKIEPIAFIIMDETGVSLLPVAKGKWEGVIDAIPGLAKKVAKFKDQFSSSNDSDGSSETGENESTNSGKES